MRHADEPSKNSNSKRCSGNGKWMMRLVAVLAVNERPDLLWVLRGRGGPGGAAGTSGRCGQVSLWQTDCQIGEAGSNRAWVRTTLDNPCHPHVLFAAQQKANYKYTM